MLALTLVMWMWVVIGVAIRALMVVFAVQSRDAHCPTQDGFCGDAREERGIARPVTAPGRRFRRRQPEPVSNTHDAVQELVLVGPP